MAKNKEKSENKIQTTGQFEGVFVGLIAVGRGRYEPAVINTRGGEIVNVLMPYKSDAGYELHVALRDWNVLVTQHIRKDTSRLWRNAVDSQPDELPLEE